MSNPSIANTEELSKAVNDLQKENKELKEEMKRKDEEYNMQFVEMKNMINQLRTEMNGIKDAFKEEIEAKERAKEEKERAKEEMRALNMETEIIKKVEEKNLIESEIKGRLKTEIKGFKKLYDSTKDGDSMETLHNKIDGIENTVVLLESAGGKDSEDLLLKHGAKNGTTKMIKMPFYSPWTMLRPMLV